MMLGGKSGWLPQGCSGTGEEGCNEVLHKPRLVEWGREEKDVRRREVSKASSTTSSGAGGRRAPRHSWANEASARADRRHLLPLPPPAELPQPGSASHAARCAHLRCSRIPRLSQVCPRQGELCEGGEHPGMPANGEASLQRGSRNLCSKAYPCSPLIAGIKP